MQFLTLPLSFSKLGFAGNSAPLHIVPTAVCFASQGSSLESATGSNVSAVQSAKLGSSYSNHTLKAEMAFSVGNEAIEAHGASTKNQLVHPVKHGVIENWNAMEKFWEHCIYRYLRFDAELHPIVLTEPAMNGPENREMTAEIWFESFNAPSLYIGVQPVLTVAAACAWSSTAGGKHSLTGTVVDIGEGVTNVVPIIDGYVFPSAIRQLPIAGKDVTHFLNGMIREREVVPAEESFELGKYIKETQCYVAQDGLVSEWNSFAKDPSSIVRQFAWKGKRNGSNTYNVEIGYERFVGGEAFFDPQLLGSDCKKTLAQTVDECIQLCPVDSRRTLYQVSAVHMHNYAFLFRQSPFRVVLRW